MLPPTETALPFGGALSTTLEELMSKGSPVQSTAVMNALLQMKKLDIQGLRKAYQEAGGA
jgi:hypothetical protein